MKGFFIGFFFAVAAALYLTGCNRHGGTADGEGAQIEPGAAASESEDVGYLALNIANVYEHQKPLDQSPWHTDGGDWTFLDCRLSKQPSVGILVGARTKITDKNASSTGIPVSWGEARLSINDSAAGAQFVDAFAKAFHAESPPIRTNNPTMLLKMPTAVLGTGLSRDTGGGFREGHGGTWTATKWFVQDDPAEAEVLFDFSLSEKRAEFSEKDPDYRPDLIQQLAVALRDGPLPERTPENDPTLTLVGPTVTNWTPLGGSNETCQFSPDGAVLAFTKSEHFAHTKVFIAPMDQPNNRKLLGEFEGDASIEQILPTSSGQTLLIVETFHKNLHMISTADPRKYWLLDAQGKHSVNLPATATNWFAWKSCISPDGNFVALHSWENGPNKQRSRVIQLGNLHSGEWRTVQLPGIVLELVGWDGSQGIAMTGSDFDKKAVRKPYSLDTVTGKLSPLDSVPAKFNPASQLSPDGKQSLEVIEKDRLIISDLATGRKREFVFQPVDRSAVDRDSVHWGNNRYLIFDGDRTALIDSQTLKMSFVAAKKADFNSVHFSPDFKFVIGIKEDAHYLGTVKLPE